MEGSVYVLTNPAMPKMVKIGKTTRDVELRLADLYSTGVPLPFECEYAAKVKDVDKTEKAFHTAFEPSRVNPKKYFFDLFTNINKIDHNFRKIIFLKIFFSVY